MDAPTSSKGMAPHVAVAGPHAGMGFREFIGLVAATMSLMALGIDTMLPALPQIGLSLGITDDNERQWIIAAYLMGFSVAQLFYGPLSDRYGRKVMMLGGIAGYILFSLGSALAPSFELLLAARVLQGVSIAATRVVTTSMVRDCYGGRQMARVMALALIVFLAVPVLAPSIGQIIMLVFPWRGLFAALALWGVVVFFWMLLRLPETLHPEYRRPIRFDTVASGIRTTLTDRQACGYMIVQALMQGGLMGYINSVEQIFADEFHAPKLMPAVFAATAGMMAIASLLNSRLVEQLGTRRLSHTAILGFTATQLVHLAIALSGHETIWTFGITQGFAMFFFGLSAGNFGAMAMEPLAAIAGTAASVQGFVVMVAGTLLGIVIGQNFNGTTLPVTLGFFLGGLLSIGVILITERGRLFTPRMGA